MQCLHLYSTEQAATAPRLHSTDEDRRVANNSSIIATDNATPVTWWSRSGGGREVLRVAAPLVVSSLSWTLMTFMDRMMLNWKSGTAMAAAFTASVAWFALLC